MAIDTYEINLERALNKHFILLVLILDEGIDIKANYTLRDCLKIFRMSVEAIRDKILGFESADLLR